jgi:hypothetical protein
MAVLTADIHHTVFYEGVAVKSIAKIQEGPLCFHLAT